MIHERVIRIIFILISILATSITQAVCHQKTPGNTPLVESLDSTTVINEIQHNLMRIGLFTDSIDNNADTSLTEAIKKFQKKNYMHIDGQITDTLRVLLSGRDAILPNTLFYKAAKNRLPKPYKLLAEDPLLNSRDENGWTPLLYATLYGNKRAVTTLLKYGANVNTASLYGTTPLMVAVIMNDPGILQKLLNQWPDLDLANHRDKSAEEIAFLLNRNSLLRRFRKHREAMKRARLGRIPPFKVRMVTWDKQECYRATTARINVTCQIDDKCKRDVNTLNLCHERGKRYMKRLTRITQKKWGGSPKVIQGDEANHGSPLNCREGDVIVFGVRSH